MGTYKVHVEEDDSSGIEIIVYLVLFTLLLPIGIIYLLYKLIKWIYETKKDYDYNHSEDFEQAVQDLFLLDSSYKDGLINKAEYSEKKPRIISRIRVNNCSNEKTRERMILLKELSDKNILSDSEYEKIRVELANRLR